LEARWGYFFDLVGLPYEYEMVGFDVEPGLRYLPDFVLPTVPAYVEVKPGNIPADEETRLARIVSAFRENDGIPLWVLRGRPSEEHHFIHIAGDDSSPFVFRKCRRCDGVCIRSIEDLGYGDIGKHTCGEHERWPVERYEHEFGLAQIMKFDHLKRSPDNAIAQGTGRALAETGARLDASNDRGGMK